MGKGLEAQIGNPIITGFVEELITTKGNLPSSKPFEIVTKPIDEYENRMRIKATDKFDVSVYLAATNFYLNQAEMQARRARGALVIYMDTEVADKIFKAAGLEVPYDEDDETMLALCGNLCQLIADALKDRLAADGYVSLITSVPATYKNNISHGVEFSKGQDEKQEISFYFLKHKALVIDWTLAPIPKK
jgi:hypothetical protein